MSCELADHQNKRAEVILEPGGTPAQTMFARIWRRHSVLALDDGESLIYVDRCLIHEGSRPAFANLDRLGKTLRRPAQVIACADHYVPTTDRERGTGAIGDPAIRQMVESLEQNARRHGCTLVGLDDPRQGILHVVAPEQGITQSYRRSGSAMGFALR